MFQEINVSNQNCLLESMESPTSQVPLPKVEFKEEDYKSVSRVISRTPTFIVFGQTAYAKGVIVNELFGQPILPANKAYESSSVWRMVR